MQSKAQRKLERSKSLTLPVRVAAYVRMSTDHQQYSPMNQMAAIRQYAEIHGMMLARVYADEGLSGLVVDHRIGLQKMIEEIVSGDAGFEKVLVYDVSRWGRFQDTDESAFYEYLCRMHGVDVIYVAEQFENDRSSMATIAKAAKRAMAADFSRDLSVKVTRAMCKLATLGFDQCGACIYGLKHVLVDANRKPVTARDRLSRKTVQTDRVVLAPGPKKEVKVVREIFRRYVELRESTGQIATYLNHCGFRTRTGRLWRPDSIARMLDCEKYIGTHVYNRTSGKLQARRTVNDPALWIRVPHAFDAVIDPAVFRRAQERRAHELRLFRRARDLSDDELLDRLRRFLHKHKTISVKTMRRHGFRPGAMAFVGRFGSLGAAYARAGYQMDARYDNWAERRRLIALRIGVLEKIRQSLETVSTDMRWHKNGSRFHIGKKLSGVLQLVRRSHTLDDEPRWRHFARQFQAGVHVIGRLNDDNSTVMDYYVVPQSDVRQVPTILPLRATPDQDEYCCSDLAAVIVRLKEITRRGRLSKALAHPI